MKNKQNRKLVGLLPTLFTFPFEVFDKMSLHTQNTNQNNHSVTIITSNKLLTYAKAAVYQC